MPKNILMFVSSYSQIPQLLTQKVTYADNMKFTPPESDVMEIIQTTEVDVCSGNVYVLIDLFNLLMCVLTFPVS